MPRPAEFTHLLGHLLDANRQKTVAITTALEGAGGFGKTMLAIALCHCDDVITAFDDGILWATLGEKPDLQLQLTKLYAALTGDRPVFLDVEEAVRELAKKLESRNCLLVIDDVWNAAHLRPFLRGGKGCARLITTRQFDVLAEAHAEVRRVNVDQMSSPEAVAVLTHGLEPEPSDLAPFHALARRLGKWPLLLGLANGALRQRVARGDTFAGSLDFLGKALDRQGLTAFDQRNATERHDAVSKTVGVSLDLLAADERERYAELAIFPGDTDIPMRAVGVLWSKDGFETEQLVTTLVNFSLLKFALQTGMLRLHDVLRSYMARQLSDPAALHCRLLKGWGDFHTLPDAYAWRWLAYHLIQAGQQTQLRELLFDFNWLQAKLNATDVVALISDFDHLAGDEALLLVRGAIRRSAQAVGADKNQLAGQLSARLRPRGSKHIEILLNGIATAERPLSFVALRPTLQGPGGSLLCELRCGSAVKAVAVTRDGKRGISGSYSHTVKVWDLENGTMLWEAEDAHRLQGSRGWVRAVAVMSDGRWAVSGADDQMLKVWDLETGRELHTFRGHTGSVNALAVTGDGRRIISGSEDMTLRVWDLESRSELHRLKHHFTFDIESLALTPDNRRAISGDSQGNLDLWDIETGHWVPFAGRHGTFRVTAIAVTPDGERVVSGSESGTLKVWELESGRELMELRNSYGPVHAIAMTPDGLRVIVGSGGSYESYYLGGFHAGELKVWDLEHERELRTYRASRDADFNAVAVCSDGSHIVSGSADGTLGVWDLRKEEEQSHGEQVTCVTLGPDERWALSGSRDGAIRVWDLQSSKEHQTLLGPKPATDVAMTPDGHHIVSWTRGLLTVWDQQSGREKRRIVTPGGHKATFVLTPDGCGIITGPHIDGRDAVFRVWDIHSGQELRSVKCQDVDFDEVVVTPSGHRAVFGSWGLIKVFDLQTARELCSLRGEWEPFKALAVTPDGRRAASLSRYDPPSSAYQEEECKAVFAASKEASRTITVWDLEGGRKLSTLRGHSDSVNDVSLTSDGTQIVSASDDQTVRTWEPESGHELCVLQGHTDSVYMVRICPDGQRLVSASQDRTLKMWDLRSGLCMATFTGDDIVTCCSITRDTRTLVAVDSSGRIHFLRTVLPDDPAEKRKPGLR